jgi:hypothetical protein
MSRHTNIGTLMAVIIFITSLMIGLPMQQSYPRTIGTGVNDESRSQAPIATSSSGDHAYVTWWSNKTGNDEVMFKASTDGGKTFGDKMNLSNSPKSESQDVQIAAAGNNVYVTWWERNQTMNEPVIKVSNDNGKTFGEKIMLSNNATTAKPLL